MMADEEDPQPAEEVDVVRLSLKHVVGLTNLLQAVKPTAKQVCCITVGLTGVGIRWEDESKTLQSAVSLAPRLFSDYQPPAQQQAFGVRLAQLVDTLGVFASIASGSDLQLLYPGPDGELQLQMQDAAGAEGVGITTYARLSCQEADVPADLTDYWAEPSSYFVAAGPLLKEAVEDLEWPAGPVQVVMQRDPPRIAMSAAGTGSLEVELPMDELDGYRVAQASVAASYKYKNLRAALANIPKAAGKSTGDISTKVIMDAVGLLKVQHMVELGEGSEGPGARIAASMRQRSSGLTPAAAGTQAGTQDRGATLQFVTMPLDEEGGAPPQGG